MGLQSEQRLALPSVISFRPSIDPWMLIFIFIWRSQTADVISCPGSLLFDRQAPGFLVIHRNNQRLSVDYHRFKTSLATP